MKWRTFFKAFIWASVFLIIGLAQLGITFIINMASLKEAFDISSFLLDGFFLFLAISVCGSIVYEFFLESEVPKSDLWTKKGKYINLCLILFMILVLIFSMTLYATTYIFKAFNKPFNREVLVTWEQVIFYISFIYALGLKWIIYYHNTIKNLTP